METFFPLFEFLFPLDSLILGFLLPEPVLCPMPGTVGPIICLLHHHFINLSQTYCIHTPCASPQTTLRMEVHCEPLSRHRCSLGFT